MPLQKMDILGILEANYNKAISLMTDDLAMEFKHKILTIELLKDYAEAIFVAIQMRDEVNALRIENWLVERFKKGRFSKKLKDSGVNPVKVYETILAGFFDYKGEISQKSS